MAGFEKTDFDFIDGVQQNKKEEDRLVLIVKDNGKGFPKSVGLPKHRLSWTPAGNCTCGPD